MWLHQCLRAARTSRLVKALAPKVHRSPERDSYSLNLSTGETVYDDRPLRFRNLTLTEAQAPVMEDIESAPGFKIRISKLHTGRRQAGTLVTDRYMGRGYQIPRFKRERDLYTFIAYDEGHLVGTVGVRLDSGERGLAADSLYSTEIDNLRAAGYRMCEFTRLAIDKTSASKPVLAGLFHTAYLYAAVMWGSTHAVIEVNPRHVTFYRRLLRFEVLGNERLNRSVNAPAVLLCVAFSTIAEGLAQHAGKADVTAERSLFRFGFTADEEAGVLQRLRELDATG